MAQEKQNSQIEKEAHSLATELLKLIGVKADVEATASEELIKIDIQGDDLGLLIGYRGENIESLQLLLGLILNKRLGLTDWRPVSVDVGGWRKQKEESLKELVETEIEKINAGLESIDLPPMPPAQRRVVHVLVSEKEGYTSESSGEGIERHIVIKRAIN